MSRMPGLFWSLVLTAVLTAVAPAAAETVVIWSGRPGLEQKAADQFAADFDATAHPYTAIPSLAGVDHAVINMHGTSERDGEPVSWFTSTDLYTAQRLAQMLVSHGFQGSRVTLVICHSATPMPEKTLHEELARRLPGVTVVGYPHFTAPRAWIVPTRSRKVPVWERPAAVNHAAFDTPGRPDEKRFPRPGEAAPPGPGGEAPGDSTSGGPAPTGPADGAAGNTQPQPGGDPSSQDGSASSAARPGPVKLHRPPGWGVKSR